mgnify:FL=1
MKELKDYLYYHEDNPAIDIYLGDCLEIMLLLPDKSVDCAVTDPPYNISKENDNRDRSKFNSPIMRRESPLRYDFGEWDNMTRDEFMAFTTQWLFLCTQKLRNGGTFISFFNKEDINYLGWRGKEKGLRTRTVFTWCKSNPVPSFRKVNYLSATEFVWIGSKGDRAWTFNFKLQKEMSNYMVTSNASSYGETDHPTEKPLSLIMYFLEIHSNKDDLILDPFLGSGTTAVTCKESNRRCIGIEISEEYCKIAKTRLLNTTKSMF